ncbi:MAG: GAF domain-containing protein [Solirubrobacteraceae bacterium]
MTSELTSLGEGALRRLLDAGRSLVAHLDLERVLEDVLEIAADVTGARYAAVGVLDADRTRLARFVTRGIDEETHRAIGDLPRGRGVLGVLISEPRPLRLANVSEHPRSYGFPAHHPRMDSFLGVPILIRGRAWGNLYLTEKEAGGEFTAADEEACVLLAEWAAVAIENARLYQQAETQRAELERVVQHLEATAAITRAVGSETELDRVLELIVKRARALVEARAVVLLLAEGEELVLAATAGQVDSRAVGTRIAHTATAVGEVLERGRAERVADVAARLALDEERLGVVGAETGLLVPVAYRVSRLGVLAAFDRLEGAPGFGDEEQSLLEAFAASAAIAVATAQSVERERLRHSLEAAERERRHWARELHDETLQGLGGLRMLLSSGRKSDDAAALRQVVDTAIEQLGRDIESLRTLITELRPAALDELGLAPAIESLTARVSAVEGLGVDLQLDVGDRRLSPELETTVYRIVQEALSNVAKHSGAERVRVRVERTYTAVEVEVADDGRGFDVEQRREGFGLVGMRERTALAGGRMDVSSSPEGTVVRAAFPLGADRAGARSG